VANLGGVSANSRISHKLFSRRIRSTIATYPATVFRALEATHYGASWRSIVETKASLITVARTVSGSSGGTATARIAA